MAQTIISGRVLNMNSYVQKVLADLQQTNGQEKVRKKTLKSS